MRPEPMTREPGAICCVLVLLDPWLGCSPYIMPVVAAWKDLVQTGHLLKRAIKMPILLSSFFRRPMEYRVGGTALLEAQISPRSKKSGSPVRLVTRVPLRFISR